MYDVNFSNHGMREAISFLFQSVLAFVLVGGELFHFFGDGFGYIRGSSALRQTTWDYMAYEAFGRPSTRDSGNKTRTSNKTKRCFMSGDIDLKERN